MKIIQKKIAEKIIKSNEIYEHISSPDFTFNIVDIGAKGGIDNFPETLMRNSNLVGFEPNPDEYLKLNKQQNLNQKFAQKTFFNKAVWSSSGNKLLYLMKTPGASSLMGEANEMLSRKIYLNYDEGDPRNLVNFYETHVSLQSTCSVSVARLDTLLDSKFESIDYLKIDVEGGERDVLIGASKLFDEQRILFVEVEFMTLDYFQEHTTLGDIDSFLSAKGLRLIKLDAPHNTYHRAKEFAPRYIDAPLIFSGNAYYFLDPDKSNINANNLFKMALAAFSVGMFNLGFSLLLQAKMVPESRIYEIAKGVFKLSLFDFMRVNWSSLPNTPVKRRISKVFQVLKRMWKK